MSRQRLLTATDEARLARRIERGDLAAKDQLITANLRLVYAVAQRYRDRGVPLDDLVQEGAVGLVRAAEKFDHRRGLKFSTYAVWWIRRSILDALTNAQTIRIPPAARQQLAAVLHAEDQLRRLGTAPSDHAIAERAGLPPRTVHALRTAPHVTASLDEPLGENHTPLSDLIADPDSDTAWQQTEHQETRRRVCSLLALLPARHREVLLRRYGLDRDDAQTHEQIADWLGVGEQRSRQLEQQGLHWLRTLISPPQRGSGSASSSPCRTASTMRS